MFRDTARCAGARERLLAVDELVKKKAEEGEIVGVKSTDKRTDVCILWDDWYPHEDCPVVADGKVCACECQVCKRAWWKLGRPRLNENTGRVYNDRGQEVRGIRTGRADENV